jgi:carotenoid phi-ring synthase / carotenoid chi-ring synthase
VGMARDRPGVDSGIPRVWFAGDWVRLPLPASLMEAAHVSARLAVNHVCRVENVEGFAVWSVPPRGLLPAR